MPKRFHCAERRHARAVSGRFSNESDGAEVPEEIADDVIAALQATKIKGKRVQVRRDRDEH